MRQQAGFTLVEMIMVLVIIGTLSAVAVAKFNRNTFESVAAAGELIAAIRHAQEKSMSNTGATNYRITISSDRFRVTQGGVDIPHPATGEPVYEKIWSNISLNPTGTISFDGYGVPTLGAPLAFGGNQANITVSAGGDSATVTLERDTGYVR